MPIDVLASLNPAQREAVQTIEGPLLILAGPGSGKTRVIVHRIAYLIHACGIRPYRIAAVTFTNKAAREMKERLATLLGETSLDLTVRTFHGLCAMILRRDGESIGLDRNFVIYDEDDQMAAIRRAMEELEIDPRKFAPRIIQASIEAAKSQLIGLEEYRERRQSYLDEVIYRVYERYEALLHHSKAVDFDDLLSRAVRLFEKVPEVLAKYQNRYVHLLVDEFQDTNVVQYLLARQMAGKYRNICVVGDPDQSIYSWRYADVRNILNFEKDYRDAKVVFLEQNYRSTKTILEAAHSLIVPNLSRKDFALWTDNEPGPPITVMESYSEQEEAQYVASEVETLTRDARGSSGKAGGVARFSLGDIAVLYRTNAQSRALEEAFLRYGTPYRIVGALRFYQRKEVKDAIAYLRLIYNPFDDVSLARIINVPPRGIGQRTLDELTRMAKEGGIPLYSALQLLKEGDQTPTAASARLFRPLLVFLDILDNLIEAAKSKDAVHLLDLVLERTGYKEWLLGLDDGEERWDNILELRAVAADHSLLPPEESLASFLEGVALVSDVDNLDERSEAVTLITLHQAKGLEFPVVFITGMEEGLLPHIRSFDDPAQMEEERRLCYVGVTRAKERLYLVRAFRRSSMGTSGLNPPSRFLADIPSHLVHNPRHGQVTSPALDRWVSGPSRPKSAPFTAGDHVRHEKFGEGVVVNCKEAGDDQEVTVAFKGGAGIKRLLLSFAPLVKVP